MKTVGFTLVEITIVIAVIAILTAITLVIFNNVQQQSRDNTRANNARLLMNALDHYYADNGEYPGVCPSGDNQACDVSYLAASLTPKYINKIPTDPAARASQYVRGLYPNKSYAILISYEATATCKTGQSLGGNLTYNAGSNTWWGSTPVCTTPKPYTS